MLYLCCTKNEYMALSVKAVLRKKKNEKSGTYPLAIRITKNRKSSYIYLGHQLKLEQWDEASQVVKKHPNAGRINNLILQRKAEITNETIDDQVKKSTASTKAIKEKVVGSKANSFLRYANEHYLKNLRETGKFNRISADQPRIGRFKEFLKNEDIAFQDITPLLLRRFVAYLKSTRSITDRTVINHLIVIRTVFNQAINANLVEQKYYPFGKKGIQIKFPNSVKIGLTREEVLQLETLDLSSNPAQEHARNIWLLSFYFAGMRVSDVLKLKWSDFQDGRLYYTMGKNDKAGSFKVSDKAQYILDKHRSKDYAHNLVFPELSEVNDLKNKYAVQQKTSVAVRKLNMRLKTIAEKMKIKKKLTMHIARHTFGNLSGDKIPIQMLQKLYRHSHITTTVNYQSNFMFKDTDEALELVIGK